MHVPEKYREFWWDLLLAVGYTAVGLYVSSIFANIVLLQLADKLIFQIVFRLTPQASYNLIMFLAFVALGAAYPLVLLRARRFETQDALKDGESIAEVARKLARQVPLYVTIFALCAFVPAWSGVAEKAWVTTTKAGAAVYTSGREVFSGVAEAFCASGAFVTVIPWSWLAWLCNVAAYCAMLWGGTWWFVYRTDRKLLGKKKTK